MEKKIKKIMNHFKRVVQALCNEEEDPPFIMLNECEDLTVFWKPTEEKIKRILDEV